MYFAIGAICAEVERDSRIEQRPKFLVDGLVVGVKEVDRQDFLFRPGGDGCFKHE